MLRDTGFPDDISPEEMQAIIARYGAWKDKLGATGQKLFDGQGRLMARNGNGVTVTDGPYAEAKEVIGGYFIIEAKDYDEAVRLSNDCPHLDFGSIEIRQIELA
jgi:hypothetical protein